MSSIQRARRALRDKLRSFFRVRTRRRLAAVGPCPSVGDHIAKEGVRVRVTDEMDDELWQWLILKGWRKIFLSTDRRRYLVADDALFDELIMANNEERDSIEDRMIETASMTEFERNRRPVVIYDTARKQTKDANSNS